MKTTLANQLPRINLANGGSMQRAQVVILKSGRQNAPSVDSRSPMHSSELRTSSIRKLNHKSETVRIKLHRRLIPLINPSGECALFSKDQTIVTWSCEFSFFLLSRSSREFLARTRSENFLALVAQTDCYPA
jgi:hypothetical protein